MRFFQVLLSGAALVSTAFAVEINDYPTTGVVAGQTYTITYSPKDQTPTTFILRRGLSTNLDTVGPIGTATGGTFTWTVPSNLPNANNYALEVQQTGADPNFSGQFPLTGGSGSVSSALSSASAAMSSASAAVSSARASASSVLASLSSRASSAAASATIAPSAGTNSTIVSATLSRSSSAASATSKSSSSSSSSTTTSGGPPQSTGAASSLDSSPLALLFGAIAAFAYLY